MAWPVVSVASGGIAVVEVTSGGVPVTEAANLRGQSVTKVVGKPYGLPVKFVNENGGSVTPPFTTAWNPADKVTTNLSNGNLTGSCTTINGSIVRATPANASGKLYFEVTWTGAFRGNPTMVGFALLATPLATISSVLTGCVAYSSAGIVYNNSFTPIASGYPLWNNATVVTICVAVDLNNDRAWFRLNGGVWNNSAPADPAANAGGLDISNLFASAGAAPVALFQGNTGIIATANFGASAFAQAVPSGFTAGWPA